MATNVTAGKSREELLAAAARLHELADSGRLDCSDSEAALRRQAKALEEQAWDAPPITAAGELTDDRLLDVVQLGIYAGVTRFVTFSASPDTPAFVAVAAASATRARMVDDPAIRHELLESARHLVDGSCTKNHWGPDRGPANHH